MVPNNGLDFGGDEAMQQFLAKLAAAQDQAQGLTQQAEQNRQALQRLEAETTEAAKALANQEAALSQACLSLENIEREQAKQQQWLAELESINKTKSLSLVAAQQELEEACVRLSKAQEQAGRQQQQIDQYHHKIETQTEQIQQAYRHWQDKHKQTQTAKAQTEANLQALSQMEATITQLLDTKEDSNHQVANAIAEKVLQAYHQNLDIQEIPLEALPKATVGPEPLKALDEAANQAAFSRELTPEPQQPLPKDEHLAAIIAESLRVSEPEPSQVAETPEALAIAAEVKAAVADLNSRPPAQPEPPTQPEAASPPNSGPPLDDEFWNGRGNKRQHSQPSKAAAQTAAIAEDQAYATEPGPEPPAEIEAEAEPRKKSSIWSYVLCVAIALLLAFVIKQYVFQITEVSGESMEPTLMSGDRVFTCSLSYRFSEPQRGDIVIFPAPDQHKGAYYVKRIIALPGEHLVISNGIVTIDDGLLQEGYLGDTETIGEIDTVVPEGKVFVMGDNRLVSHDSRSESVSFIDIDSLMSKALWRLYPFDELGSVYQ